MSDGRVWHIGCPGELIWRTVGQTHGYVCDHCGRAWDGSEKGVSEYRVASTGVNPTTDGPCPPNTSPQPS